MENLSDITADYLVKNLPKQCLDVLFEKKISTVISTLLLPYIVNLGAIMNMHTRPSEYSRPEDFVLFLNEFCALFPQLVSKHETDNYQDHNNDMSIGDWRFMNEDGDILPEKSDGLYCISIKEHVSDYRLHQAVIFLFHKRRFNLNHGIVLRQNNAKIDAED